MERRQMAPQQQNPSSSNSGGPVSLEFHHAFHATMAAASAEFGGCHSALSNRMDIAAAQQSSDDHHNRAHVAKSVKQELLLGSPQQQRAQQQNGFHPHMGGDNNELAMASGGSDFFSPAALQHFLLPQLANTDFDQQAGKDNANNFSNNFCAASSASTAPADPQPSIINNAITKSKRTKAANSGASSGQHPSTGAARSGDRKRPYPCSLCVSRFGSKMELEEHQNSHTGQKPFQCDVCQSGFNRRSTLWNHKRIHSDAKPFVCTICHMQFKWKNSLKCHKEMHLRKNELPHVLPDSETHAALTYATAAKKKMGELTGADPASITLLPTYNASSHLLTCAGTPRKRAPARPKGSGGGGSKSKQTASSKAVVAGRLPSNGQLGNQQHSAMARQPVASGKSSSTADEAKAAQQRLRVEGISRHMENGGTTATATATPIGGLDFARFHCGPSSLSGGGGIPSSHQQQQQFLHFDPLLRPGQSSAAYEQQLSMDGLQQQMGPPDLLMSASCNGGGQSSAVTTNNNLQLQLGEPAICCSLLQQDFPGQQCFVDQQQSRSLPAANFLGFDLNSLAGIQPGADPNSLLSTSASSSVQFPVGGQFMAQQQQSTTGFAGCSTAVVSSSSNSVLNTYQFDPASVRFLAAAAEISHQQHSSASSNDQQQQQQVMTTADY